MRDREERYRLKEERRRLKDERRALRKGDEYIGAKVRSNITVGLIIAAVGACLLARQFGAWFPDCTFTWPVFIIAISFVVGAKSGFRDFGWVVIAAVGTLFLLDKIS